MSQFVGDILKSATIVSADCSLRDAVRLMRADNRDRVYVTNDIGRVSGVVCDFTLLKALVRGESSSLAVGQFAAPLQDHLLPTQPLDEAAVFFREGFRTQMPVLENGQFLGIVERTSLLAALLEENLVSVHQADHSSEHCNGPSVIATLTGFLNQQSMKTG